MRRSSRGRRFGGFVGVVGGVVVCSLCVLLWSEVENVEVR